MSIKVGDYIGVDEHPEPYKVKSLVKNKLFTECGKEFFTHHCYWVPIDYELPLKINPVNSPYPKEERHSQKKPISTRGLNET